MSPDEVRNGLFDLLHRVAPEADLAKIAPDENLREALDIDSFDFLKVIIGIHEVFGVEIPESAYSRIATLRGMIDYLSM